MKNKMCYEGMKAFGEDKGTLWPPSTSKCEELSVVSLSYPKKEIKKRAAGKSIIWFIDDERANRDWFAREHCDDFTVITFSEENYASDAYEKQVPCDAVVTDIFFPTNIPESDEEANRLLSIYSDIDKTPVINLPTIWHGKEDKNWKLNGFEIAKYFNPKGIPVFLYSRKAIWLLSIDELVYDWPVIRNTYWLIEKPKPSSPPQESRRAAFIQKQRIIGVLQDRASWWQKLLKAVSINVGPFSISPGVLSE